MQKHHSHRAADTQKRGRLQIHKYNCLSAWQTIFLPTLQGRACCSTCKKGCKFNSCSLQGWPETCPPQGSPYPVTDKTHDPYSIKGCSETQFPMCVGKAPHTTNKKFHKPAGCPRIQLSSDIIDPETTSASTGLGLSPTRLSPAFPHQTPSTSQCS